MRKVSNDICLVSKISGEPFVAQRTCDSGTKTLKLFFQLILLPRVVISASGSVLLVVVVVVWDL